MSGDIETQALALLSWLVTNFGSQLVMATFGIVTGSTAGMVIEDATSLVADVLNVIRSRVEDSKIKEILNAEFDAADAVADAAEKAKFG